MKKLLILTVLLTCASCVRRHLYDGQYSCESAQIEVVVDWSNSGITPSDSRGDDYVHMVSVRFFPLDGSSAFDRYLQLDVYRGFIDVPVGEYSVVVYNESIGDPYWADVFTFENVDDYDLFAARIVEQDASLFPFYEVEPNEKLSSEALKLASWSLDYFRVTPSMATGVGLTSEDESMLEALTHVALSRLTTYTTLTVEVENLASASKVYASLDGLSQLVYMASGETSSSPVTHVVPLTDIVWYGSDKQDGEISERRLTFTTLTVESDYFLTLDVLFIDGSYYEPEQELVYDVTDQISGVTRYADTELSARVSLSLPEINSGIDVDDWDEQEDIIIK